MRAVGIRGAGGLDRIELVRRMVRGPRSGEVRLAVEAAAVNPADILLRRYGIDGLEPPWVPGMDAAGVVESVGAGVEHVAVGDAVMAALNPRRPEGGAQAELVVLPAAAVVRLPDGVTVERAATLPMNGLTALLGLAALDLRPGQALAVSGAAGVLASYVIPLAKIRGLRVLADASPEDEPLVRSFGADVVLPRGDGFSAAVREATSGGADGFFDAALLGRRAFPAIQNEGALAAVRGWDDGETERAIQIRQISVRAALDRAHWPECTPWLEELCELAARGVLQLRVAGMYDPAEAAVAQRVTEAGGLRGRAVIVF